MEHIHPSHRRRCALLSGLLKVSSGRRQHASPLVIARRRSRRGNPVPSSYNFPPHRPREAQDLWIAASAAPPRNDGMWGMSARGGVGSRFQLLQGGGNVGGGIATRREIVMQQRKLDGAVILASGPFAEVAVSQRIGARPVGEQVDHALLRRTFGTGSFRHGLVGPVKRCWNESLGRQGTNDTAQQIAVAEPQGVLPRPFLDRHQHLALDQFPDLVGSLRHR